nr:organic solute transporter alpha-like protein [Procambarus clarkii]
MASVGYLDTQDEPQQPVLHSQDWLNYSAECVYGYTPTIPEYIEALGMYRTAIHTVGSLITAAFFVFYCEHIVFTYKNTNTVYRRHINWIACFYPVGALMTTLALVVPRSHDLCNAVKIVFFSLGVRHFVDLTVLMFGCEKGMLGKLKDSSFDFHVGLLRCCPCIPSPTITKTRLRVLKWLLWQFPYSQTVYFFLEIFWTAAKSNSQGLITLNYGYLCLDAINIISSLSAIYAFTVMGHLVKDHLGAFNYKRKYGTMLVVLVLLKVLEVAVTILGNYNFFPCYPPYINSMVYANTVLNLVHLGLLTFFGGLEYWQYHTEEFLQPISDKHHQHSHELIIHGQACVCIISEMTGVSRRRRSSQVPIVMEDSKLGHIQEGDDEDILKDSVQEAEEGDDSGQKVVVAKEKAVEGNGVGEEAEVSDQTRF